MKVKQDFICFSSFTIRDGSYVRFWEDKWFKKCNLKRALPSLYNIDPYKQDTVANILDTSLISIFWRRDLIGPKLVVWNDLSLHIANIILTQDQDMVHWSLDQREVLVKITLCAYSFGSPQFNKVVWQIKRHY